MSLSGAATTTAAPLCEDARNDLSGDCVPVLGIGAAAMPASAPAQLHRPWRQLLRVPRRIRTPSRRRSTRS